MHSRFHWNGCWHKVMNSLSSEKAKLIKNEAVKIGFDACGFAEAAEVSEEAKKRFQNWLEAGYCAEMEYMRRYEDILYNPCLLVEKARSIIVVALNYFPAEKQPASHPQFAYYAYGEDYHTVMKKKLAELFSFLLRIAPDTQGRYFTDTAPIMEKYWAQQAGIGFIGRNTQLIIPHKGSYFFLGVIVSTLALPPDIPQQNRCGNCRKCIDACPTGALSISTGLNANKCLSYQTIENRSELPQSIISNIGNRVYGCDTCQQVCPYNRFAVPSSVPEFRPHPEFLQLDYERMQTLSSEEYRMLFKNSAVKRAKYEGLKRNIAVLTTKNKKHF